MRVAGVAPKRRFLLAIANHQSSGSEIAEPLMLARRKHGNDSNRIEERNLIDVADEVAGHRFEDPDGAAGPLNHANSGDALARSAAVPECLKQSEVAPVEQEDVNVKMATVH